MKNQKVSRYYLILFQKLDKDMLDRDTVRLLQAFLDEKITTKPEETEIDIWIESPGGDAHAAYKLILDLRSRSNKIYGVVPDIAKSAATLLLLGVDKIYMAPAAELGPLDVQLEHPDREDLIVSGLDIARSFEFLINTAIALVIIEGNKVRKWTGLTRQPVLHETLEFVAQFLQPAVAKLDPSLVHQQVKDVG